LPADLVYTRPGAERKPAAAPGKIGLDAHGALVVKAAQPGQAAPENFVAFAVTALREYAKEQENYAAAQPSGLSRPDHNPQPQRLLARLKLFS
jgi:hypothetical protein